MYKGQLVFLILIFTVTFTAFQNCTSKRFSNGSQSDVKHNQAAASGGNGTGYDGKPYVTGLCSDLAPKRRALLNAQAMTATMTRDNCLNLAEPFPVVPVQNFEPRLPQVLILSNEAYSDESLQRRLFAVCSTLRSWVDPVQVQIWTSGTEYRGEVQRMDVSNNQNYSTGELRLNRRAMGASNLDFESQETVTQPGTFFGSVLFNGNLSLSQAALGVGYFFPGLWQLEVEPSMPCVINP